MATATLAVKPGRLSLGPRDIGRPLSEAEYDAAEYQSGYRYELIRGRLYVMPAPELPHDWVEQAVYRSLLSYAHTHSKVINYVTPKARVYVPGLRGTTSPEPDITAYKDFPIERLPALKWREVSPLLVVEVLSPESLEKDLIRNCDLYLRVPTIQEYWVIDILADAARPTLTVHRRRKEEWQVLEVAFGEMYTTKLLPGLELKLDPRRSG
jgi:Uma2 family endonuclease